MCSNDSTIQYYSTHAKEFYRRYKKLRFEDVHAVWLHIIPTNKKIHILDVGAGSGRDALWFAQKGHKITAVEPADGLRELAKAYDADTRIRWVEDHLPGLHRVKDLKLRFDLILNSAVWMHIDPKKRKEAFDNLAGLLSSNGILVITLRNGESTGKRFMHPVNKRELFQYAEFKKLEMLFDSESDDLFGRRNVKWETVVFKKV